jgi:hypothetical protein
LLVFEFGWPLNGTLMHHQLPCLCMDWGQHSAQCIPGRASIKYHQ